MRTHMSLSARRELALRTAVRYKNAARPEKKRILDEFLASTGFHRKHATRLLNQILRGERPRRERRGRVRRYGAAVQDALITACRTVNYICGKRLVPFLPELLPTLERHGHLSLSDPTRQHLLGMSASTADRILRQFRVAHRPHGKSTTKSGQLLKHRVPIRTFADWEETGPGFMEADLVAHCGVHADGPFLHTLVLTDVATGWTECLALLHRSEADVLQALQIVRQLLPFQLVGLDTDNGSEFMNYGLLAYCERETIQFTRGRARRKNDQCFVEQKNGSIVRQLVGYDRYEGPARIQTTRRTLPGYPAVREFLPAVDEAHDEESRRIQSEETVRHRADTLSAAVEAGCTKKGRSGALGRALPTVGSGRASATA